jgi:hypothetical protein
MVIYDLVMQADETRDVYLNRMCDYFDANWTELSREQLVSIREHVTQKDYPETIETWQAIGGSAGLSQFARRFDDPSGVFTMMEFAT